MFSEADPEFVAACKHERERVNENIRYVQERISTLTSLLNNVEERLRPRYELAAVLRAAGFNPDASEWSDYVFLDVEQKDLRAVYRVTGRLRKEYTDLKDARKRLVEVCLSSVKYPCLRLKYVRKLKKGDPCQLVRERIKARTEVRLVCSVPAARATA